LNFLSGAALEPQGETRFQTVWRRTRAVRRQAPLVPLPVGVAWRDDPHRKAPHVPVVVVSVAIA